MKCLFLTVNIILAGALFLQVTAIGEFDPDVMPPTSAGMPLQDPEDIAEQAPDNGINCDERVYRVSIDGIIYVRASRRGVHNTASATNNFGVYRIENEGYFTGKVHAELDSETVGKLNFALYNCDGESFPSGIFPPEAGSTRLAQGALPLYGEKLSDIVGVSLKSG